MNNVLIESRGSFTNERVLAHLRGNIAKPLSHSRWRVAQRFKMEYN